jgi:hypothetical protein
MVPSCCTDNKEDRMGKFILVLGTALLTAGTTWAAEPLSDPQLDKVSAGIAVDLPGATLPQIAITLPASCAQCFPNTVTEFPFGVNPFQLVGAPPLP